MKLLDISRRVVTTSLPLSAQLWIQRMYLAREVAAGKRRVEAIMKHLPLVVHSGEVVFDIGANIGAYTFELSQLVSPGGHVYAFEPFNQNYRILLRTIRKARLQNVTPLKTALSDKVGPREMVLPGNGISAHSIARFYSGGTGRRETVTVETLDHLCSSGALPVPSFIKCDVEGFPLAVLRGAEALIRKYRPTWLIELWGDHEVGFVSDIGYKAYYYRDGSIHETKRSVEHVGEYFLFPR